MSDIFSKMSQITKKLLYLDDTKEAIKAKLLEKGVAVSESDTFRSYADKIEEIKGGSGDAVVWYVTFIGADGSELFKMPVLDGDDCKDPITHGDITTPTKESSVQYNYTYSGWSATSGGSANSSVLKSIKEDKTVYAAFTSSTRYYTITYYDTDGVTVLKTESLAYGATPSYVPEKSGFSFIGWQPALDTVVGDMSYTAQWQEKVTFAGGSWADINDICARGEARQYFSIGESRKIPITYCGVSYEALFRIAAFDHDDLTDGSGKAKMTVVLHEMKQACFDAVQVSGNTNYGSHGFILYPINNLIIGAVFDSELTAVLKAVNKPYPTVNSYGNVTQNTRSLKKFLLSAEEAGCTFDNTRIAACGGSAYELYQTNYLGKTNTTSKIEYDYSNNGFTTSAVRNIGCNTTYSLGRFCELSSSGVVSYNSNTNGKTMGVFGFCI